MRFYHGWHVADGVQEVEQTVVAVSLTPLVNVLVQPILVLDMNNVGLKLVDLVRNGPPPASFGKVYQRHHPFASAVRMADDQNVPVGVMLADKLPRLFAKRAYSTESRGIATNHNDGGRHMLHLHSSNRSGGANRFTNGSLLTWFRCFIGGQFSQG